MVILADSMTILSVLFDQSTKFDHLKMFLLILRFIIRTAVILQAVLFIQYQSCSVKQKMNATNYEINIYITNFIVRPGNCFIWRFS